MDNLINYFLAGDNNPPEGKVVFDSTDHIRFQNGQDVSGHNYGCHRRFVIENNISGEGGYTVTLYNLDGKHPLWNNNVQMAPKQMRIIEAVDNIVVFRGFGYDEHALMMGAPFEAASYENYGIIALIEDGVITRIQLNLIDRNICIVYLK